MGVGGIRLIQEHVYTRKYDLIVYDLGKKMDSTSYLNILAISYPILKKYGRFGIAIEFSVI